MRRLCVLIAAAFVAVSSLSAQAPDDPAALFDRILDTYVRDGFVYYRALKSERAALDRYVQSLDVPAADLARRPAPAQLAFWLNAYNALVLHDLEPVEADDEQREEAEEADGERDTLRE